MFCREVYLVIEFSSIQDVGDWQLQEEQLQQDGQDMMVEHKLVEHSQVEHSWVEHKWVEHKQVGHKFIRLVLKHIRLIRLVIGHIRLVVVQLIVRLIALINVQLISQLGNIQLSLDICQLEHILKIKKLNTGVFFLKHLRYIFCLIFNCIVVSHHSLLRHLHSLSNFLIFNIRFLIRNILNSALTFNGWLLNH